MLLSAAHKIIKENNIKKNEKEGIPNTKNKCFICDKTFSLILRQHQCKNCLKAVCANCSPKKLIVHEYDPSNKTHRVCNICYPRLSKITSKSTTIHKYEANGLTQIAENINELLTDPNTNSISVWLSTFEKCWLRSKYPKYYKTKQKELLHNNDNEEPILTRNRQKIPIKIDKNIDDSNPITIIKAGTLWINIIEAMGIPNHNPLDKPDVYARYYVTDNIYDKAFTESKEYETHVVNNSFNPQWNRERTIPIYNTTGNLVIELWDKDLTTSKFLGSLHLKLSRLFLHYSTSHANDNNIIDDWFEVKIIDRYKNKINNKKNNNIKNKKVNSDEKEEQEPVYKKVDSIPNMRADDSKKC